MSQSRRLPSHSPQEKKLYKCQPPNLRVCMHRQPLSPHLPKTAQTTVNTTRNLCFTFVHSRRTTNKQHGKTPGSPAKAAEAKKSCSTPLFPPLASDTTRLRAITACSPSNARGGCERGTGLLSPVRQTSKEARKMRSTGSVDQPLRPPTSLPSTGHEGT
jgi:hypothetical protein